jgi:uncharacterized protein
VPDSVREVGTAPDSDALFDLDVEWLPIAGQARRLWTVTALGVATPGLLLVAAGLVAAFGVAGAAASVVVVGGGLWLVRRLVVRRHAAWGYAVREDDLVLRRGLLVRRLTLVPVGRMQFVDIQQGPLDRWLGVANVRLHTAAAASDAHVPMLGLEEASGLRDELLQRGGLLGGT